MTVSRNHASTPTFMPRAPHRSRDGLVVLLIVPYERYSLRIAETKSCTTLMVIG